MQEDHAQLRMGHAPEMLAILNNIVLGLFARQGERNMAHARRNFAYHLDKALASLVASWRSDFATALKQVLKTLDILSSLWYIQASFRGMYCTHPFDPPY